MPTRYVRRIACEIHQFHWQEGKEASEGGSGKRARNQATKQARKQADKKASKQASKQTNKQPLALGSARSEGRFFGADRPSPTDTFPVGTYAPDDMQQWPSVHAACSAHVLYVHRSDDGQPRITHDASWLTTLQHGSASRPRKMWGFLPARSIQHDAQFTCTPHGRPLCEFVTGSVCHRGAHGSMRREGCEACNACRGASVSLHMGLAQRTMQRHKPGFVGYKVQQHKYHMPRCSRETCSASGGHPLWQATGAPAPPAVLQQCTQLRRPAAAGLVESATGSS